MDEQRLDAELAALETQYTVQYCAAERIVVIEDWSPPDGWSPQHTTLRIKLPQQYGEIAPSVRLQWDLRYQGTIPRNMLISRRFLVRGSLGDDIVFWPLSKTCTGVVDETGQTLATLGRQVQDQTEDRLDAQQGDRSTDSTHSV